MYGEDVECGRVICSGYGHILATLVPPLEERADVGLTLGDEIGDHILECCDEYPLALAVCGGDNRRDYGLDERYKVKSGYRLVGSPGRLGGLYAVCAVAGLHAADGFQQGV